MTDTLRYHTLDELRALSIEELRALWDLVPTERQRLYRTAYEREVKATGAEGSDARERQVAVALLKRYRAAALIPVGTRWARAPGRVQAAARSGEPVEASEADERAQGKPSVRVMMLLGAAALVMVVMLMMRGRGGEQQRTTPTVTPVRGMTPTPLALEAQDEVIAGGDSGRTAVYPINLQVSAPDQPVPRFWVVQRRSVRASQWNYDPNPDTASYLSGMAVRPVIGIPWSEENAAWFEALGADAEFRLQMNTGAILTFIIEEKRDVRRSDTGIFRQITPGLVLLLLGETDEDGFPTGARTMVVATYLPEQELSRGGELIGALALPTSAALPTLSPTPTPTLPPFAGLDVQLIRVTYGDGQITTRLRLYNGGSETMTITPDDIWLALGYAENPRGSHTPAGALTSFNLLPDQAADMTLVWLWAGEPYGNLSIGSWRFSLVI